LLFVFFFGGGRITIVVIYINYFIFTKKIIAFLIFRGNSLKTDIVVIDFSCIYLYHIVTPYFYKF